MPDSKTSPAPDDDKVKSIEAEPQIDSDQALVPDVQSNLDQHPFVIFISDELKSEYLRPDSAFLKIVQALSVPQISKYLSSTETSDARRYACIWCIGLDIESEKQLLQTEHSNILFSPDILSLKSNEEKKAMYTPLKAFISSNAELISQL